MDGDMRWLVAGSGALLMLWGGYVASPYWALWDLADALDRRDVPRLLERVNVRAVRFSLSKQVAAEGLTWSGQSLALSDAERQAAAGTIAATADPLAATLVTGTASPVCSPAPSRRLRPRAAAPSQARLGERSTSSQLRDGVDFGTCMSRYRRSGRGARIRLQFRLSRLTWRLVSVDLPPADRRAMLQDFVRAQR
jgi:hypothetical protein